MVSEGCGVASAQNNLGLMYSEGGGLTQSDTEAVSWLHKASVHNLPQGEFNLGMAIERGKGGCARLY